MKKIKDEEGEQCTKLADQMIKVIGDSNFSSGVVIGAAAQVYAFTLCIGAATVTDAKDRMRKIAPFVEVLIREQFADVYEANEEALRQRRRRGQ